MKELPHVDPKDSRRMGMGMGKGMGIIVAMYCTVLVSVQRYGWVLQVIMHIKKGSGSTFSGVIWGKNKDDRTDKAIRVDKVARHE